jgi:hypothetical protein
LGRKFVFTWDDLLCGFQKIQRETARGLFEIFEKFHQVNRPFTLRIPRDNARINFVREKIPPAKKFSLRKKK